MIKKAVAELIPYKPFGLWDIERLNYDKGSRCRTYPILGDLELALNSQAPKINPSVRPTTLWKLLL